VNYWKVSSNELRCIKYTTNSALDNMYDRLSTLRPNTVAHEKANECIEMHEKNIKTIDKVLSTRA